jgi:hypothetical protein
MHHFYRIEYEITNFEVGKDMGRNSVDIFLNYYPRIFLEGLRRDHAKYQSE